MGDTRSLRAQPPPYTTLPQLGSSYWFHFLQQTSWPLPLSHPPPPVVQPAEETGLAVGSGPVVASRHPGKVHGPGNELMVLVLLGSSVSLPAKWVRLTVPGTPPSSAPPLVKATKSILPWNQVPQKSLLASHQAFITALSHPLSPTCRSSSI